MDAPRLSLPAGAATAAALVVIVVALIVLGPPSHARERRLDDLRIEDLTTLSNALDQYWMARAALPDTLDSLLSAHLLDRIPADPKSGAHYPYHRTGTRAYRLCATFAQPTDSALVRGPDPFLGARVPVRSWRHGTGESCFDLRTPERIER